MSDKEDPNLIIQSHSEMKISDIEGLTDDEIFKSITKPPQEELEKRRKEIEGFSEEEKAQIEKKITDSLVVHENGARVVQLSDISEEVESIISKQKDLLTFPEFFKHINATEEFGVPRFILDRMYYLSALLQNTNLDRTSEGHYLVTSEVKDSNRNSIKLEHRFKATNDEEAEKLYEKISSQLSGIQLKIWLACWSLANRFHKHSFTCYLTELMTIVYPNRKDYFSVSDKVKFYEHLRSLEQTKFVFSKPYRTGKKKPKNELYQRYEIPLLQILTRVDKGNDKYPKNLTLSLLNSSPDPGKMAYVGAPFKNKTLELHPDDTQLATWIQTRKSQSQKALFIEIDIEFLFDLAGLQRTASSNRTQAKKQLRKKLERVVSKGIMTKLPEKLDRIVRLQIR